MESERCGCGTCIYIRCVLHVLFIDRVQACGAPIPLKPTGYQKCPRYTLGQGNTMLKVLGVLIKLSYRGHVIGLMSWYDRRVETPHPE